MSDGALHMIGNAHLDPVWLWRWREGFQEAKATFRSALDRMAEYPDWTFTSSSAAIYAWIERNEPEMLAEIRARVAEGRWHIAGGWWIQPDCNLPSGESFVRQGLYGQRYLQETLGVTATAGYNVDSFGHAATLPQILRGQGMDAYVFMRPKPNEKGLPAPLFWWEAPDGSRVLTYRLPYAYATWEPDLEPHVRACAALLAGPDDAGMCFYGVGNHGGGPTRENLESIRKLQEEPELPELVWSTPARFFAEAREHGREIPVVRDELQHHAVGCYAAHSGVKRWNRRAEQALVTAEKLSVIAERVGGQPYPADLTRAWKAVLFNQFHDILAGTSIESAYEDARDSYGEATAIAARAANDALQRLSWRVHIEPESDATPIVVFNPHPWPARLPVELELGRMPERAALRNPEGRETPAQAVRSEATVGAWRSRLCFLADLPPTGYAVYRLAPAGDGDPPAPVAATDTEIENEYLRLAVDSDTGCLTSLLDKRTGQEVLAKPAAVPMVFSDRSDTWSHGVTRYEDEAGAFRAVRVGRAEHGPVKSSIRVSSAYGDSRVTQEFALYAGLDHVEVRVTVDWRERFALLKLGFPLALRSTTATYEAPYGHIERESTGDEEPGQSWLDVSGVLPGTGEAYGVSLLTDAKYSYSTREGWMDLTVLRSPIYAHHDPFVPEEDGEYTWMDQGVQRFTYALLPHAGTWRHAATARRAAELNQPPLALVETAHPGPLPQSASYLSVEPETIAVGALKKAEDGGATILRCVETHGVPAEATIRLPGWNREITATFRPSEFKTFRIPDDAADPVTEVNLLEWEQGGAEEQTPPRE
jgi:alpha-mannosidase